MWFSKPKSYLGIDVGAGGIKVVELKQEKNRPVLFTYGFTTGSEDVHRLMAAPQKTIEDLRREKMTDDKTPANNEAPAISSEQIERYAALIQAVCREAKTVSKTAVVSLSVSSVFHALLNLPILKKEETSNVINAELKKLLPRPLNEMAVDYQLLPHAEDSKTQRVLINAVPRDLIFFYTQVMQKAGLKIEALEPESTALERTLVGKDKAVTVLVDMGAERTNFFIIDQSVPITHHSLELGGHRIGRILNQHLQLEEKNIEQVKYDYFEYLLTHREAMVGREKFKAIFSGVFNPIAKEIEYALEVFLRQTGNEEKRVEKIVLAGGGAFLPYLTEYLSDHFKIRCYVGDPWARVVYQDSLKPVLHSIGPRLAVAIGLALRNMV